MPIRPIFILCMASALNQQYAIDFSLILFILLWSCSWRSAKADVFSFLSALGLIFLLEEFKLWHTYFLIEAHPVWEAAGQYLALSLSDKIEGFVQGNYAQFLQAVLVGDKSALAPDITTAFRSYGISHMLAVSGFHIGFWVLLLRPLTLLGRTPLLSKLMHLIMIGFLLIYAMAVGGSHSVLRAVWTFAFAGWASKSEIKIQALHWPMLIGVCHFLVDPSAPSSLSFQLSYTAVLAILWVLQPTAFNNFTQDFSTNSVKASPLEKLLLPIYISLAAWSATLPIVQHHFSGASPYFLIGNLAVVPVLTLFIWASVPALLLGGYLPSVYGCILTRTFEWFIQVVLRFEPSF